MNAKYVAVAAGVVQHRFDPDRLLHQQRQSLVAHARGRPRAVGNIHRIHAYGFNKLRAVELLLNIDALRRHDLNHGDKLTGRNLGAQPRALRHRNTCRHGRRSRGMRGSRSGLVAARSLHAQRRFHRANMIRCGAAASADQLHARRHELARVTRHIFGRAQINVAALDRARHAGVGLGSERQGSGGSQTLDRVEHGNRANAAIDPGDVYVPFRQASAKSFRVRAVEAVPIFVDGDVRDDRNFWIHVTTREHGLPQLFKVSKRLKHEEIDTAFSQSGNLLAKRRARFLKRSFAERFDANSERSNRARDPDIEAFRSLASHARARQVDLAHAIRDAVAPQAKAVSTERVGLDDLRARLEVIVVNPANHVRLRDVQLVVAPIDENSLGVQQRPHRSVAQHGDALQSFLKILRHRYQNTGMRRNLALAGLGGGPVVRYFL